MRGNRGGRLAVEETEPRAQRGVGGATEKEKDVCRSLHALSCFHGFVSKQDAESLIIHPGDFLVRAAWPGARDGYRRDGTINPTVIVSVGRGKGSGRSVCSALTAVSATFTTPSAPSAPAAAVEPSPPLPVEVWHLIVKSWEGGYMLTHGQEARNRLLCATIPELIRAHCDRGLTFQQNGAELAFIHGVPRPDWELRHRCLFTVTGRVGVLNCGGRRRGVFMKRVSGLNLRQRLGFQATTKKELSSLYHPNLVRYIGVAADQEPLYVVSGFMRGPTLQTHLRAKRSRSEKLAEEDKLRICLEVAAGMQFLEHRKLVHSRLSTHAVFWSIERLQISDYALDQLTPPGTPLPPAFRTAPEVLREGRVGVKSDVWDFGLLVVAVFKAGAPWPEGTPGPGPRSPTPAVYARVREAILDGSLVPSVPAGLPPQLVTRLTQCWDPHPCARPDFARLFQTILPLLSFAPTICHNCRTRYC